MLTQTGGPGDLPTPHEEPGFDRVEIPGEREREQRAKSNGIMAVPEETWAQVLALSDEMKGAGA